jgi:CRP/FNR family cyclic AMP-dependent transcriptional regulator
MGIMISPETLRRFPLFASFEDRDLKKIAMLGEVVDIPKDIHLFDEGKTADAFYIILEGQVMITVALGSKTMERVGVTRLGKGELLGWSALVEPYRYQLGALTLTSCKLAKFRGAELCELMTHHPDIGCILMSRITQVIGDRLVKLRIQMVSLIDGGRWQRLVGEETFYLFEGGRAKPTR